jgi:hypothetical protein
VAFCAIPLPAVRIRIKMTLTTSVVVYIPSWKQLFGQLDRVGLKNVRVANEKKRYLTRKSPFCFARTHSVNIVAADAEIRID